MRDAHPEVLAVVPERTQRGHDDDGAALTIEKVIADR
jgi:hypothetical protein